jgi:hypothetical protein
MANVVIDIAAEFTGNKAFKQAETSTDKLVKGVKKLAAASGLAFGTAQVIAFGKASVKASLDAQAQQDRLANLVKVTVGATQTQIQSLNDQAAALQNVGVVSKENITQTQSQLATFNLQVDTIKQLTPAILDYVTAEKGATASADQFKQMTNGLAQALNGNFTSLTRVGFVLDEQTKKIIKNGTESEKAAAIVDVLNSTYKDFNKNLTKTDAGKLQILANAANDAQEIIGTGLLDAVKMLGKDESVANLAAQMESVAIYTADVIRGIGVMVGYIKTITETINKIPFLDKIMEAVLSTNPIFGAISALNKLGKASQSASTQNATALAHLAELESRYAGKTLVIKKKLTAEELKALKAKRLQQAIDKANLALGKSDDVFNIDKIQIAAALTNQAEQLGKATSGAQLLQIANDTARLNVKKSILALEDAIAAKDEAAIIAATAKLNEDLKVLNALTGQKTQMAAIESILKGLTPKDLINQNNLDEALRKIKQMMEELAKIKFPTPSSSGGGSTGGGSTGGGSTGGSTTILGTAAIEALTAAQAEAILATMPSSVKTNLTAAQISGNRYEAQAEAAFTKMIEQVGLATQTAQSSFLNGIQAGLNIPAALSGSRYAAQAQAAAGGQGYVINIQTGVGDPNAIAEAIDEVLRQARDRGTLTVA